MSVRRHYHCWSHTPIHAPISWALPPANVMVRKPPSSGSSSCSASASVSCSPVVSSTRSAQATSAHTHSLSRSRTELSHEDRNRLADGLAAGRRIVLRGTYKQRRGTSGEPKSHDPSRSLTHSLCTHPSPSNRSHRARASAPCLALQRL